MTHDRALTLRIRLKCLAMESKRVANLSFHPGGMASLCKQVVEQVRANQLCADAYEVDLTGTRVETYGDLQALKRIVKQFRDPICLRLGQVGLREVDWLIQLISNWTKNKKLDLSSNDIPVTEMEKLVRALETRRKGYWLAIGCDEDLKPLLNTPNSCHPHSWRGCLCRAKRTVHVVDWLRPFSKTDILQWEAMHLRRAPPLTMPPYVRGHGDNSLKLAGAIRLLRSLERAEEDCALQEGRAFTYDELTYHVMTDGDNYILVNLADVNAEGAKTIEGDRIQLDALSAPLRSTGPRFLATAASFTLSPSMEACLRTNGGETLLVRFDLFKRAVDGRGWVAAVAMGKGGWRWFPLDCVLLP